MCSDVSSKYSILFLLLSVTGFTSDFLVRFPLHSDVILDRRWRYNVIFIKLFCYVPYVMMIFLYHATIPILLLLKRKISISFTFAWPSPPSFSQASHQQEHQRCWVVSILLLHSLPRSFSVWRKGIYFIPWELKYRGSTDFSFHLIFT